MPPLNSLHLRRKADKVRLAGWINVALTIAACFFVSDPIAAFIMGAAWIVLALAVTQTIAWRIDVKADRTRD